MSDLSSLIARLEKAEGPSRVDDHAIHEATNPPLRSGLQFGRVPAYTSSLDAAVSLAERVLPGWMWGITQGDEGVDAAEFQGNVWPGTQPFPAHLESYGYHRLPAISLVLAILCALDQGGSSNG